MKKILTLIVLMWALVCAGSVLAEDWQDLPGSTNVQYSYENQILKLRRKPEAESADFNGWGENWDSFRSAVQVTVDGNKTIAVGKDAAVFLFSEFWSLSGVDLSGFDFSSVTSTAYMFQGCYILEEIEGLDGSRFSNVVDMTGMFYNCGKPTSPDLSGWDTRAVKTMDFMFFGTGFESLDLSSWETPCLSSMSHLFDGSNLRSVDLSSWDTDQVTDMSGLFASSRNLESVDLSGWNFRSVTDISYMFYSCTSLTELDLSIFDSADWDNVNAGEMFGQMGTPMTKVTLETHAWSGLPLADGTWNYVEDEGRTQLPAEQLKNYNGSMPGTWTRKPIAHVKVSGISQAETFMDRELTRDVKFKCASEDLDFDETLVIYSGSPTVSGTDAGEYPYGLSAEDFSYPYNKAKVYYLFEVESDGHLKIEPHSALVGIIGNFGHYPYDGHSYSVSGYKVGFISSLYRESYFTFSGEASVSAADAGRHWMGLSESQFTNNNPNFDPVVFGITDGFLEIVPWGTVVVTITGNQEMLEYDGEEHEVLGYKVTDISDPLYTQDDFRFSGTAAVKGTDNGKYPMGLSADQFTNTNQNYRKVEFEVIDGFLEIEPASAAVEISGHHKVVTYNGQEQRVSGYEITGFSNPLYTEADFTFSGTAEAKGTDAGRYPMGLSKDQFTNTNANFTVDFDVADGSLEIEPAAAAAEISGHHKVVTYNGQEQRVSGYEITGISNPLYSEADFTFSGTAEAKGTDAGRYPMGLSRDQFTNTNANFTVNFDVADGSLTVEPKNLNDPTISAELSPDRFPYDGKVHRVNVTVADSEAGPLVPGRDYEFTEDSVTEGSEVGTYSAVITAGNKGSETSGSASGKAVSGKNYTGRRSLGVWEIYEEQPDDPDDPEDGPHFYRIGGFPQLCERCELPATGFSSRGVTPLSVRPAGVNYEALSMELQIPVLDLKTELVKVPLTDEGWPVEWLGNRAGVLEGGSLPGAGYSVAAAHNTLNAAEYGPFALLSTLRGNDMVFVRGADGMLLRFRVYANELLAPDDLDGLASIAEQKPGALVLLTCENESPGGGYLNRRAVFAEKVVGSW